MIDDKFCQDCDKKKSCKKKCYALRKKEYNKQVKELILYHFKKGFLSIQDLKVIGFTIHELTKEKTMIEKSLITTNIPEEMSITFPAKYIRNFMTQKEIDDFFDEITPIIIEKLKAKLNRRNENEKSF